MIIPSSLKCRLCRSKLEDWFRIDTSNFHYQWMASEIERWLWLGAHLANTTRCLGHSNLPPRHSYHLIQALHGMFIMEIPINPPQWVQGPNHTAFYSRIAHWNGNGHVVLYLVVPHARVPVNCGGRWAFHNFKWSSKIKCAEKRSEGLFDAGRGVWSTLVSS